jgi:hypothetical protein
MGHTKVSGHAGAVHYINSKANCRSRRDVPLPLLALGAGLGVNAGTVVPMAATGISDPRTWSAASWISDLVPNLAHGTVTALVFEGLAPPRRRRLGLAVR